MANYKNIIPFTMDYEGANTKNGGLVDIKEDSGGITKFGVCLEFAKDTRNVALFDLNDDGIIDRSDIKIMTREVAEEAFKKYFWDKYNLDAVTSDKKAFVVFDAAMNNGNGNAIKFLQRTLVMLGLPCKLDYIFGNKTFTFMEQANTESFCSTFLSIREGFFKKIVANRPSQKIFLKGWLNRITKIKNDLKRLDN